jgi:hypothetical protein
MQRRVLCSTVKSRELGSACGCPSADLGHVPGH